MVIKEEPDGTAFHLTGSVKNEDISNNTNMKNSNANIGNSINEIESFSKALLSFKVERLEPKAFEFKQEDRLHTTDVDNSNDDRKASINRMENSNNVPLSIKSETVVLETNSLDNFKKGEALSNSLHNDNMETNLDSNHEGCFSLEMTNSWNDKDGKRTNKIECLLCGVVYKHMTDYTHHLNTHLQEQDQSTDGTIHKTVCPDCFVIFPNEIELAAHKTNCSEHRCKRCGKKCLSESNLKIHVETICKGNMLDQKMDEFLCKLCRKSFTSKTQLVVHVRNIHRFDKALPNMSDQPKMDEFLCKLCSKSFNSKTQLIVHVRNIHRFDKACPRKVHKL